MTERAIFEAAIEIADATKRSSFLDEACAGNEAMRARILALLKSHDEASGFLRTPVVQQHTPAVDSTAATVTIRAEVDEKQIKRDSDPDMPTAIDLSFLAPSTKPGSIGVLGHYEILSLLGHGAFGIVFKAFDEKLHRLVAIKAMNPQLAVTSPPRKRFLREARSVAAIKHENIVQVYSVEEEPLPFLVMEYIDGQTLQQKLDNAGPLETPEVLYLARQMAAGLAAAHEKGLIHRDIKPGNILLESGAEQKVKITDFGLARAADDASITTSGVICGTPMYMAPEQAQGYPLDQRADLFSLGSVLYQMVSGRPPFRAANAIAVLKRVVDETPRPIHDIIADAPGWLCSIINKLHAKRPDERFQSARELADLLNRCQNELQFSGKVTCVKVAITTLDDEPNTKDSLRRESPDEAQRGSLDDARRGSPDPAETADRRSPNTPIAANRAGDLRSDASAGSGDPRTMKSNDSRANEPLQKSSIPPEVSSRGAMTATWKRTLIAVAVVASVLVVAFVNRRMGNPARPSSGNDSVGTLANQATEEGTGKIAHPMNETGWHGWPANAPKPAIAPFNADEARQHQEAWAKYLNVPVEYENSLGMKFRLIPPGEFMMGSTPEEIAAALKDIDANDKHWQECIKSEAPQHKVILTQPIYLGVNEVTQAEYEKVMGVNPSHFAPMGAGKEAVAGLKTTDHPVEMVSWNDAAEFCAKLSQQEKLKPFYFRAGETITPLDGTGYRLPSEAEWECACRAGTTTKYWIGEKEDDLMRAGWSYRNSGGRTHAVGELKPNPFGLTDIHANVWEWVQDGWDATWYGQFRDKPAFNPNSPFSAGSQRVLRGGVFGDPASHCRSSFRLAGVPSGRNHASGFRMSLLVDAVREALKVTGPAMPQSVASNSKPAPAGWHGWPANAPKPAIAPFNADEARQHQEAWAKYLNVPVEYTNSIGMKLRLIPPGEFTMGSTKEEVEAALKSIGDDNRLQDFIKSEAPQHTAVLTQPIYLGIHEVTQAQYENVMGRNPSAFSPMGTAEKSVAGMDTSSHPVENVGWSDAADFCAKLSQREKHKPFYFRAGETITPLNGGGYRFPSEAEWEFACRAGTTTKYWFGDQDQDLVKGAWFGVNSGGCTHAVGELIANPFGHCDLLGNIWEWVADGWDPVFYRQFSDKPSIDPESSSSTNSLRVCRGGARDCSASQCRVSHRLALEPTARMHGQVGFRVSLPVDAVREALKLTGPAIPKPVIASSSPAPIDSAAERKAAEWALSVGATTLQLIDEQGNRCDPVDGKLPEKPFAILHITIWDGAGVRDDDLARLKPCRRLQGLVFHKAPITGRGLVHLAPIDTFWLLDISDSASLTDSALASLKQLPQLRELRLAYNSSLTDESLAQIGQLPNLETLILLNLEVGDKGIKHLSKLSRLNHVELGRRMTDAGIRQLCADHPQLRGFGCCGTQLTAEGLRILQSLPALESIRLVSPMTTEEVLRVSDLSQLREIELYFWNSSDLGDPAPAFTALTRLQHLERIRVHEHELSPSDSVLESWAGMASLKSVTLRHNEDKRRYTAEGIAKFRERRPDVQLSIDGKDYPATTAEAPIDYAAERKAAEWALSVGATVLQLIDEQGNRCDPVDGKLSEKPFAVQGISILNRPDVTDDDLARLARCRRLQGLQLIHTSVTGSGLEHLAAVRSLWNLVIIGGAPTDLGLKALTRLPQLRHLEIVEAVSVTDAALVHVSQLRRLEILSLDGTPVGDLGVKHLKNLSQLREVILGAQTTNVGIRELIRLHPQLEMIAVDDTPGSGRTLDALTKAQRLADVHLTGNQLTADGLRALQTLPNLRRLQVLMPETDEVLRVTELPQLREVLLFFNHGDSPSLGDDAYAALSRLPHLENIAVFGDQPSPSDSVLESWAGIASLKSIMLRHNEGKRRYTAEGIAKFRERRPDVQLSIDGKDYPATTAEAPIDYAAERKAAERLLKLRKGWALISKGDDTVVAPGSPFAQTTQVELKEPLPQEPFYLLHVKLREVDLTDDELAAVLAGCRGLNRLDLDGNPKLTAAGLKSLGVLPNIGHLDVSHTACARDGLEFVANYPKLFHLAILGSDTRAGVLQTLPVCAWLHYLATPNVSGSVGNEGLRTIARQCPQLRHLELNDDDARSLALLAQLPHLKTIQCRGSHLSDASIDAFAEFPAFDTLSVDSPDLAVFQRLSKLNHKLRELRIREQGGGGNQISDPAACVLVTQLTSLEKLTVDGLIAIDAASLQAVAKMPRLKSFSINSVGFTDGQRATYRNYTADDIATFRKARPDVTLEIDGKTYPVTTEAPIDYAAERKAAEWVLSIGGGLHLADDKGQPVGPVIGKLPDGEFVVTRVYLGLNQQVRDADLARLRGCRRLQFLALGATMIDGSGLVHFAHLPALTELHLNENALTNSTLAHLARMTQLRHLNLVGNPEITDAGIVSLEGLTQLEELHLPDNITDVAAPQLARLNRLREFYCRGTAMTDAGVSQIIAQHPDLERLQINDGRRTLAPLVAAKQLRRAGISGSQLSPEGLRILQTLTALEAIRLFSNMTDEEVTRLSEIRQLREVEIYYFHGGGTRLADAALVSFTRLPKLEAIEMHGHIDSPTDAVLKEWATIPTLKKLTLLFAEPRRKYTPEGIDAFRKARPDVEFLIDGKTYPATKAP